MRSKTKNEMPDLLSQMGYEPTDVNLRSVFTGIIALFVFIALAMLFTAGLYTVFIPGWYKAETRMPMPAGRRMPPHPQIQTEPRRDMALYRQAEDALVAGKGNDGHGHNATMSVDDAMTALATQKGIAGVRGDAPAMRGNAYPGSAGLAQGSPASNNAPAVMNGGEK